MSALPLSMVTIDDIDQYVSVHDVRASATLTLINDLVPRFQPDWKSCHLAAVKSTLNLPADLNRELIVRTAITDGRAEDDKLFALECLNPEAHNFDCTLSISDDAGTLALWQALSEVLPQALCGLGKTDAIATHLQLRAKAMPPVAAAELVFVTLQSDAAVDIDVTALRSTGDGDALLARYRQWFEAKSNSGLELSHFFARQRYVGGHYLHKRFGNGANYQATLLTEAGSVFAFKVLDPKKAETALKDWVDFGLPVANDGQRNPYRRENGYGEVRADSGPPDKVRTMPVRNQS